jgi:hypothetical protein
MNDHTNWKLTAEENAVDSLEMAVRQLSEVDANPWAWKWICFALHDALYSFGVCATAHSDLSNVNRRDGKLKGFDDVLRMAQDSPTMRRFTHSKPLVLSPEQSRAIDLLKKRLRNPLAHYQPRLWYIELSGLPEVVCHVLDVIEFLAVDSGNVMLHNKRLHYGRVRALCEAGRLLARHSLANQKAEADEQEIRHLRSLAPAIEVHTEGTGVPAQIATEIMALSPKLLAGRTQLVASSPPREPSFSVLCITVVGAVPFAHVEQLLGIVAARLPTDREPWEELTSDVTIRDLDNNVSFDLPAQRDEAIAYFRKRPE